jgi:hypothetical protein
MDVDDALTHAEAWWVELLGALVALSTAVVAYLRGDYLLLVVAVVLAVYAADRARIRLDNRSMARVLENVREGEETD